MRTPQDHQWIQYHQRHTYTCTVQVGQGTCVELEQNGRFHHGIKTLALSQIKTGVHRQIFEILDYLRLYKTNILIIILDAFQIGISRYINNNNNKNQSNTPSKNVRGPLEVSGSESITVLSAPFTCDYTLSIPDRLLSDTLHTLSQLNCQTNASGFYLFLEQERPLQISSTLKAHHTRGVCIYRWSSEESSTWHQSPVSR